jgi:uncharacterized protein YqhQ
LGKRFHYGGQAVIEGVMMRGRGNVAVAVRRPNGEIALRREPLAALFSGRIRELPFVRGPIVLLETLILGVRSLYYSASVALEDEEETLSPVALWGIVALGFIIALVLFVALPLVISRFVVEPNIEGDMRAIVGKAEHKTINAYEAGEDLEVDRVRPYGTAHTRCGTGFILIVLMIAILAHAFLGDPALWIRFLERLAILPLIGALSYELIKYSADHTRNRLVKIALVPGMALQSMTTREPEDDQIEVAISALKSVLADDVKSVGEPAEETAPVTGMTGGTGGVDL